MGEREVNFMVRAPTGGLYASQMVERADTGYEINEDVLSKIQRD